MKTGKKKLLLLSIAVLMTGFAMAQTTAKEWYDKGIKLMDDESYTEAITAFEKASALDPKDEDAFYKAGWCYNDIRKYDKAVPFHSLYVWKNLRHLYWP